MSFLNAIAAFKGAFLGALLGNNLPRTEFSHTTPQRPEYGHPGFSHARSAKPYHRKPYPHPYSVSEQHLPSRPLYPLYSLNR